MNSINKIVQKIINLEAKPRYQLLLVLYKIAFSCLKKCKVQKIDKLIKSKELKKLIIITI